MSIEFKFQTVVMDMQELQEKYPDLVPVVNSYIRKKKTRKKRKSKKKRTAAMLIDEIIDIIN